MANIAFIIIGCYYVLQQLNFLPNSRHAIQAFLVSALLDLLQLKYQGKSASPFETHPITMWVAIASLLLYCLALAYDAEQRFSSTYIPTPTHGRVFHGGMALLGWLCSVSLASVLVQGSVGVVVLYLVYVMFSATELLCIWLQHRMVMERGLPV